MKKILKKDQIYKVGQWVLNPQMSQYKEFLYFRIGYVEYNKFKSTPETIYFLYDAVIMKETYKYKVLCDREKIGQSNSAYQRDMTIIDLYILFPEIVLQEIVEEVKKEVFSAA